MMSRTVTALFDSRSEAEAAGARLASDIKVQSRRVLAKDTAAAVDGLRIGADQSKIYREALQSGGHLLVVTIGRGEDPKSIIKAIVGTAGRPTADVAPVEPMQSFKIASPPSDETPRDEPEKSIISDEAARERAPSVDAATDESPNRMTPEPEPTPAPAAAPAADVSVPTDRDEFRIDEPQVVGTGQARANDQSTTEGVSVKSNHRGAEQRLTYKEVEERGLLKDRTIEVVEMSEEPVVTKEIFVHEQVIVRKTVGERTETIRESLRHTEVEVEELPAPGDSAR